MVFQAHQVYKVKKVNLEWVSLVLKGYQASQVQLASLEKKEIQGCLAYEVNKDSQVYLDNKDSEEIQASLDYRACQAPRAHQEWAHRDCQGPLGSQDLRGHQDFLE